MAANHGATGAAPTTGGRHATDIHGYGHGLAGPQLAVTGPQHRVDRTGHGDDHLRDLAPHTQRLLETGAGRPVAVRNLGGLRRDPARVVGAGKTAAVRGAKQRVEANRRTRLRPGIGKQLAAHLHRVARVHAHLCAIVRLYGNPSQAGGQSLRGDTYAAQAARGDRTLLHVFITQAVDELTAVRNAIEIEMDSAPPTTAAPGTAEKIEVMAQRVERGESLFIKGDSKGAGDGSSAVQG